MTVAAVRRDGPGIFGIEYDTETHVLVVEFERGKRMAHHGVPASVAADLMRAKNPKSHLIHRVRGFHKTERLPDAVPPGS